jgi:3-oxoacyl-[acyl-carrier-protein] synthase III
LIEEGGFNVFMNGNAVFKHAIVRFGEVINEALAANGFTSPVIMDLLVPHQANIRISDYVRQQLRPCQNPRLSTICSVLETLRQPPFRSPLSEAWENKKLKDGDLTMPCCIRKRVYLGVGADPMVKYRNARYCPIDNITKCTRFDWYDIFIK